MKDEEQELQVKNGHAKGHVAPERLQAFLDGELPDREHAAVEDHLAICPTCAAERDEWLALFEDLQTLTPHRPLAGFSERVLSDVRPAEPIPSWAGQIAAAIGFGPEGHVAPEVIQTFFDGEFGPMRSRRIAAHIESCESCALEANRWATLEWRLTQLESFAPAAGFADRVMAQVRLPDLAPAGLVARMRIALGGGVDVGAHVAPWQLGGILDGGLTARQMARTRTHLATCESCADDVRALTGLRDALEELTPLRPTEGFAERVMKGVAIPRPAPMPVRRPVWAPVLAVARALLPRTKKAWAALSGAAVTPAVTAGLMVYAVFSSPSLTLEGLVSFAWWQISDLATAAGQSMTASVMGTAEVFGLGSALEAATAAPFFVAAAVLLYSLVCAFALRVLYTHLIANRPSEGRYARIPTP